MAEIDFMRILHHANIIQMYGYYNDSEEKMLIYEFLSNKILDYFIFDENENESRREPLLWTQRLQIIQGIAQGLLYLHDHAIVHLDMKPDNILLDANLNPKISDFGMAKMIDINKSHETAKHVTGTMEYMPAEYKCFKKFSTKTDIYSFGVLMLEILSGRRNTPFVHLKRKMNLVGHAWEGCLYGEVLTLKDPKLGDTCTEEEFLRTLHVALLCVQEEMGDRPSASQLVTMLSHGGELTQLVIPSFMRGKHWLASTSASS